MPYPNARVVCGLPQFHPAAIPVPNNSAHTVCLGLGHSADPTGAVRAVHTLTSEAANQKQIYCTFPANSGLPARASVAAAAAAAAAAVAVPLRERGSCEGHINPK